uniref:JmjC domain-containing protein n=1 Tax=Tetradesmus obliquus TaxID=3088 RepID=A0A383V7E7_TETOB|eukprot:jgi/Sobl393_1/19647/SZX61518.1
MCNLVQYRLALSAPYPQFNPEDSSRYSSATARVGPHSEDSSSATSSRTAPRFGINAAQQEVLLLLNSAEHQPSEEQEALAAIAGKHADVVAEAAAMLQQQSQQGYTIAEALRNMQQLAQSSHAATVAATYLQRLQASIVIDLPSGAHKEVAGHEQDTKAEPAKTQDGSNVSNPSEVVKVGQWKESLIWSAAQKVGYMVSNVAAALFITAWVIAARFGVAAVGSMLACKLTTDVLFLVGAAAAVTFAWLLHTGLPSDQMQQLQQSALATWLFISPAVFKDRALLDMLLDALLSSKAVTAWDKDRPKRQQAWDLLMGSEHGTLPLSLTMMHHVLEKMGKHAKLVEQKAGQGVWVPPGWLHWVFNNQACFKIAYEVCPTTHAAACCYMQRRVRFSFWTDDKEGGYICVRKLVMEAFGRWCKSCPPSS